MTGSANRLLALGLLLASACSGGGGGMTSVGPATDGTDATGSGTGVATDTGTGQGAGPIISDVVVIPNPVNHLAVTLRFETDVPSAVAVVVDNGAGHDWQVDVSGEESMFSVDIVGLRAQQDYGFEIVATSADGESHDDSATYQTAALPEDFPPLDVAIGGGAAPGWTIFNVARWTDAGTDPEWGVALAVDSGGEVVWYHRAPGVADIREASAGGLLMLLAAYEVRAVDWMGRTGEGWFPDQAQPPVRAFHHEAFELSTGNLLSLSVEVRNIDGYDDGMGGTVAYDVVGDIMVEVAPGGEVVHTRSLLDLLPDDHYRVRPGFDSPFWDAVFAEEAPNGTKDWSHGNAVVHDPDNDLILVCSRHLDWIVAYERDTGDLAWKLGEDGDFSLGPGSEWFYHPHAVELVGPGQLVLYDNGNNRPGTGLGPGDTAPYSRAVLYELDTTAWTATEVWSLATGEYAPFLGDADVTPENTILITHGGQVGDPSMPTGAPTNPKWGRIVEVDPVSEDELFSIQVGGPDESTYYSVYRAERVPVPGLTVSP